MKIGIDARLIEETGVGRYIRNLISELAVLDTEDEFIIYLRKKSFDSFIPPNEKWQRRLADVPWHTAQEQFVMPWILVKEHLDILHVPYFNIPVFYPGRMIITIHDLTILHFNTGKATTLPLPIYKLRRLGYYLILAVGLIRSKKVIAVSETTKKEIIDHFHMPAEKIAVTYEGIDEHLKIQDSQLKKTLIDGSYLLYVGNAYPHKNLESLTRAFKEVKGKTKLVLVGKEDFFYKRLKKETNEDRIIFYGEAKDSELANLYAHATALVFPSLMEGFGLPALEAISMGCPVVCSDIPVLHEILGEQALYFDPNSPHDIQQKIERALEHPKKPTNVKSLIDRFQWSDLAKKTILLYHMAA